VKVDDSGHWPHLEQPATVAAHLDAFLTRVLPSQRQSPQRQE
jgi:pimeloyl-ACP methyl ester carboxylesterase